MKKKYKYMHILNGRPAHYVNNRQIVFSCGVVENLCDTLKQLKKQQLLSEAWRLSKGWIETKDYGYLRVVVD